MAKRRKSKTTKVVKSAKRTLQKTGAGIKRVAKKAARATGMACRITGRPGPHLVLHWAGLVLRMHQARRTMY